jgi:hypothetical protein
MLVIFVIAAWLFVAGMTLCRGVGHFDQLIIVEANKPVQRVAYCDDNVDDEIRSLAEQTADPRIFVLRDAEPLGDNRYLARIMCTSTFGTFRPTKYHQRKDLAVYVEFTDGTRQCRIADLPRLGNEPVVIHLR